jgi:hypothetical protein
LREAHAQPPDAFHATNAGGEFRAEEPGIRRFIGDASHGRESEIDGGRRVAALLEVDAIAEDDGAVEGQARLRAVPGDKFSDGVFIGALTAGRSQVVQHGDLRVFEVREGQEPLRALLLAAFRCGHRRRPPSPSPTASPTPRPCGVFQDRPGSSYFDAKIRPNLGAG